INHYILFPPPCGAGGRIFAGTLCLRLPPPIPPQLPPLEREGGSRGERVMGASTKLKPLHTYCYRMLVKNKQIIFTPQYHTPCGVRRSSPCPLHHIREGGGAGGDV